MSIKNTLEEMGKSSTGMSVEEFGGEFSDEFEAPQVVASRASNCEYGNGTKSAQRNIVRCHCTDGPLRGHILGLRLSDEAGWVVTPGGQVFFGISEIISDTNGIYFTQWGCYFPDFGNWRYVATVGGSRSDVATYMVCV